MTRAVFETLETQKLIDYLSAQGVKLEEEDIAIFKKQRISGEALLELSGGWVTMNLSCSKKKKGNNVSTKTGWAVVTPSGSS